MITDWQVLLEGFSGFEISLMVVNAILLIISYPLFNKLSHGHINKKHTRLRLNVFRSINALIIALLVFYQKLVRTRQAFMEIIIQCAEENNISFATPVLYQKISA